MRLLLPDDPTLDWRGVIEVEHTGRGSRGWRLPLSRIDLFPGEGLQTQASRQAGVRVVFGTDARSVGGRVLITGAEDRIAKLDLVVDDQLFGTVAPGADGRFTFSGLPEGRKQIELWPPQFAEVWLREVEVDEDAEIWPAPPAGRPRMIVYGSSISHCYEAESPTQTWPALVAREVGLDLTCLGFSGQCHLDPMVGRLIRDLPADLIVTCLGINVHRSGVLNERSFLPAVLGLLSTIRDGHPGVPILVISPICCPEREDTVATSGMTLTQIRGYVGEAVRLLRRHGDDAIELLDGLDVLGPDKVHLLADGLHPNADGYHLMAGRIAPVVQRLSR